MINKDTENLETLYENINEMKIPEEIAIRAKEEGIQNLQYDPLSKGFFANDDAYTGSGFIIKPGQSFDEAHFEVLKRFENSEWIKKTPELYKRILNKIAQYEMQFNK